MLQNWFFNWLAKQVGNRVDGKKLRIGMVLCILYGVIEVLQKIFPNEVPNIPVNLTDQDWDTIIGIFKTGFQASGAATVAVGVAHKAYKEGLQTPCPPTLDQKPAPQAKAWDGRIPGQFP